MNSIIPDGWEISNIGKLGQVITGSTPSTKIPAYWNGETPFISPADFKSSVYVQNTRRTLSVKGADKSRLLPKDSILVTCIGSLGGIAMNPIESTTNQQINALVPNINNNRRFCFYAILHNIHELKKNAGTTTLPIINKSTFETINILRAPLPEQQKIASILTSVDDVIEKTESQISKLQDLKNGMMQELLTKGIGHTEFKDSPVGRIPVGWHVKNMENVVKVVDSLHQTPSFSSKGYPMVRVSDIRVGKINLDKTMKVDQANYDIFIKNHKPKRGDLLMSRVGSYGVCAYLDRDIPLCIGQNTVVIIPNTIDSMFLFYVINSFIVQDQIEFEVAGSGYKSLSLASIRNLNVVFPTIQEQLKIASILSSIDNNIENKQRKLQQNKSLKKSLMQDLLTGKVRVKTD